MTQYGCIQDMVAEVKKSCEEEKKNFMTDNISIQDSSREDPESQKVYIQPFLNSRSLKFSQTASLANFIISVIVAVGPVARLFARHMYFTLLHKSKRDYTFLCCKFSLEELKFWHHRMSEPSTDSKSDLFSSLLCPFTQTLARTAFRGFTSNPGFIPMQGQLSESYRLFMMLCRTL